MTKSEAATKNHVPILPLLRALLNAADRGIVKESFQLLTLSGVIITEKQSVEPLHVPVGDSQNPRAGCYEYLVRQRHTRALITVPEQLRPCTPQKRRQSLVCRGRVLSSISDSSRSAVS